MSIHRRPFRTVAQAHETQLCCFETMLRSGVAVAVPAALEYCQRNNLTAPPWLLAAATDLLCHLLKREKSTKRGRACGFVARYRQDTIDYTRWDQVMEVRRRQVELRDQVQELRQLSDVPQSLMLDREKMLAWAGSTLQRSFECAAMLLQGSAAYGSPDAMKKSYFNVRHARRDPRQRLRYHQIDPCMSQRLGVSHQIELRPGRKKVPLYELTI